MRGRRPLGPLDVVFTTLKHHVLAGMRPFPLQDSAMAYQLHGGYSPLHLEDEAGFDASFRRRFEDLVRVQAGMQVSDKRAGTKVEWIGRIVPLLKEGDGKIKGSIDIGSAGDRQPIL
jgi:hypothetical protein